MPNRLLASSTFPQHVKNPTPAVAQYLSFRAKYKDCILLFQMGDFFELFFDQAETISHALGLTLTARGKSEDSKIPMCGIPVHSSEMYIARLIKKGFKVVVCKQTEETSTQPRKTILQREVTKIFTPGTIVDDFLLENPLNNFLMVITSPRHNTFGLALTDATTGDFFLESTTDLLKSHLLTFNPREILVPFEALENSVIKEVEDIYKGRISSWPEKRFNNPSCDTEESYGKSLTALFKPFDETQKQAAFVAIDYIKNNLGSLCPLKAPVHVNKEAWVHLDDFTKKNLEIFKSQAGDSKHSLFAAIDKTLTAPGKRLLHKYLQTPSYRKKIIEKRLSDTALLKEDNSKRSSIRTQLKQCPDLERSLMRLMLGGENPKDLEKILFGLQIWKPLAENLPENFGNPHTHVSLHTCQKLLSELAFHLKPDLPRYFTAGMIIKAGASQELDALRNANTEAENALQILESELQNQLGISGTKIKANNMIGLYIEFPSKAKPDLPKEFYIKQGLAKSTRYGSSKLDHLQEKTLRAEEAAATLEKKIFLTLIQKTLTHKELLSKGIETVAYVDVITSFAELACCNNYVKPKITDDKALLIKGGRHPVVEKTCPQPFTKNNCFLSEHNSFLLMTAPNMAGKSTYLRQNALIVLLAHIGCFVPADEATIGLCDRLFSRVGASDDITRGHSTFMIEMIEVACILRQATQKSLVILDEVGRGTSTQDGLAIAAACIEHLVKETHCRTFFATHYAELTNLQSKFSEITCHTLDVKHLNHNIIFTHSVRPGVAFESYGLEVARLAGVPTKVLKKALVYKNQKTLLVR